MALAELDTDSIKARPGSRLTNGQAREIAPVLHALEARDGLVHPQAVVEAARDPASPLHALFEWDDAKAAEEYRIQTARTIIRSITYRVMALGKSVNDYQPMFVRYQENEDGQPGRSGYGNVVKVLGDEDLRKKLLDQARRELDAWIRRYETLAALANAMGPARELLDQVKKAG
jgi:hypothetical protein